MKIAGARIGRVGALNKANVGMIFGLGDSISPDVAFEFLSDAQIAVRILADPNARNDVPGQDKFDPTDVREVSFIGETHGVSLSRRKATAQIGFSIPPEDVDLNALMRVRNCTADVELRRIRDIVAARRGRPARQPTDVPGAGSASLN